MYRTYTPQKNKRLDWYHKWWFFRKGDFGYKYLQIYGNFGYLCWNFLGVSSFCQAQNRPFLTVFEKNHPRFMRLSCCLGEGGIRQRFRRGGHFFRGTHTSQVGGVGEASENVVFFKRIWRKNYPPKKMCPKNGTPVQKELSGDMFVFQGRKNFYHFTSSPKKTKKTLGNNQWLNHKGRTNTKFHFPLVNTKVYGFHILWLGEVGR